MEHPIDIRHDLSYFLIIIFIHETESIVVLLPFFSLGLKASPIRNILHNDIPGAHLNLWSLLCKHHCRCVDHLLISLIILSHACIQHHRYHLISI